MLPEIAIFFILFTALISYLYFRVLKKKKNDALIFDSLLNEFNNSIKTTNSALIHKIGMQLIYNSSLTINKIDLMIEKINESFDDGDLLSVEDKQITELKLALINKKKDMKKFYPKFYGP